jgi:hypothetical protein
MIRIFGKKFIIIWVKILNIIDTKNLLSMWIFSDKAKFAYLNHTIRRAIIRAVKHGFCDCYIPWL